MKWEVAPMVSMTHEDRRQTDLILRGVVDLSGQALSLGLTREKVLGLVQTQAEDLSVQVIVLIPQLKVFLRGEENIQVRFVEESRQKVSLD